MKKAKSLKLDLNQVFFKVFLLSHIFACISLFFGAQISDFVQNVISKDLGRITDFWKDLEEKMFFLCVKMADNNIGTHFLNIVVKLLLCVSNWSKNLQDGW